MPDTPTLELRTLYERYGRAVYHRCRYFLRDDEQARDAMHDVFVKALEAAEGFAGDASPLTWLVRITTNHCLNILRARRARWHERYAHTVRVDAAGRGLEGHGALEARDVVRAVLHKLDADVQRAAVFYYVDEMSQADAACAAGCSVPTLRKRLRRFVEVARRQMGRMGLDVALPADAPL